MGNSGNTADRWYHRAALEDRTPVLLGMTLDATPMTSLETALSLLAPISLEQVSSGNIFRFVRTAQAFGSAWTRRIFKTWLSGNLLYDISEAWLAKQLPTLCRTLCTDGGAEGKNLARDFKALIPSLLALLRCGRLADSREFQQRIVEYLSNREEDLPATQFVELSQAEFKGKRDTIYDLDLRTRVASLFPNEASCLRLVTAVLQEIHEEWVVGRLYLDRPRKPTAVKTGQKFYRKRVA